MTQFHHRLFMACIIHKGKKESEQGKMSTQFKSRGAFYCFGSHAQSAVLTSAQLQKVKTGDDSHRSSSTLI